MSHELLMRRWRGRGVGLRISPRPRLGPKLVRRPFGFVSPCPTQTLSGLEFSLRRPKWLKQLKVGRILGKVVKIGAIVGAAAIIAPGAAGFALRGGRGLVRGAGLLRRVGGKVFRVAAGRKAPSRLPFGALRRAARFTLPAPAYRSPGWPTATAPAYAPEYTPAPAASLPIVSEPAYAPAPASLEPSGGGTGATEEASAVTQAGIGGMNPALLIGGLVIGGLLLTGMGRRKGRAA